MAIEEPVKKMILFYLAKWKTTRLNKDKLKILQEEMMKKFEYRTLPLITIKKWVRIVVKETKQSEKLEQIKYKTSPIAAPTDNKAFLQSFAFDLIAMRKTVENISGQLSVIKSEMDKNRAYAKIAAPNIAAMRKVFERISDKLAEIEKKVKPV